VEVVSFRAGATLAIRAMAPLRSPHRQDGGQHRQPLYEGGRWVDCRHIASSAVEQGKIIEGPAVVEDATATLLIPSGWIAKSSEADNIIMTKG
jgi:N-methylhydantoinase A